MSTWKSYSRETYNNNTTMCLCVCTYDCLEHWENTQEYTDIYLVITGVVLDSGAFIVNFK